MDRADYRRTSYETWEAIAPGWERWRARLEEAYTPVREWLIRELAPRVGDTVLELSAGADDTGFSAAAIVGERGRLISTDFSPDMVEVARRRGAELERSGHSSRRRLHPSPPTGATSSPASSSPRWPAEHHGWYRRS